MDNRNQHSWPVTHSWIMPGTRGWKKLNVLQAIKVISAAWQIVKPETIVNCWRKGGFGNAGEEIYEATIAIPVPDEVPESDTEDFIAWVAVDDDVEVTEKVTTDEMTRALVEAVVAAKTASHDPVEEDDDEEPEPVVSSKEMKAAIEILERGHRQNDLNIENFESVMTNFRSKLRDKFPHKQRLLTSFFDKN